MKGIVRRVPSRANEVDALTAGPRLDLVPGHHCPENGAPGRDRTDDILITNQALYQLSYKGKYPLGI